MGLRQQRLADEIRDIVASCFLAGQMADPRVEQVTITHVKLSPDLQVASVYYRVYEDDKIEPALAGLENCKGFLRKILADKVRLRRIPNLRFFYDESIEHGSKIEKILVKIKKDDT